MVSFASVALRHAIESAFETGLKWFEGRGLNRCLKVPFNVPFLYFTFSEMIL